MTGFLFNLLLALAWAAVGGELSAGSLAVGFAVGFAVLYLVRPVIGRPGYHSALARGVGFALRYLAELFRSGFRVAHDVLTPTSYTRPGIIAYRLRATTDAEITAVANLISLTPGTLSLDVSPDRTILYVHAMFADDERAQIARLEDRVLRLMRGEP
jgi:multicomponent Na+:H+ antiporter subunit E